ncbi:MAG: hypothetical protein A2287_06685 [Candidatus Melainabacteria bacterium RIFOXYA12_FULL_32_12]|nr:MAG: hypothetical protein A2287_06685 [Candidatus Melainabacteria bacterium RIFOXYA12_FULL_32_12]
MRKNSKQAFTLLEVLITFVIAGIIALMAIPTLMGQIKDWQVKEDILKVEQAIKEARSNAITRSRTCLIDFSQASTSNGQDGGLVQVKQGNGTLISQFYLSKNVLYNSTSSTISSNVIRFDFRGQPVDSSGATSGFTTSTNQVTISYYKGSTALASKSTTVTPVTGYAKIIN